MNMCDILSWTTMWVVLAVWEIMKMTLMVLARYNFLFTRPRFSIDQRTLSGNLPASVPGYSAAPSWAPCSGASCLV